MKHLGHLLAADLRRHPVLLLSWILIVIASTIATGLTPALTADPTTRAVVGLLGELIWAASVVLMILIVAMVIQIHPVVGSSAFWMTRPIPALTLLTAKVILLAGAIVVLPGLARTGLMWAYEVPVGRILMIALQDVPSSAFLLVLLMSAAALTPTLPRFMLLCAGVLAAAGVLVGILLAIAMAHSDENLYSSGPPAPDDPTGGIVLEVLLILAALVLLRTQYRTRSRLRALGIGAVAICSAVAITEFWPWPLLRVATETPAWANQSSMLQLTGVPASLRVDSSSFRTRSLWRVATADIRLSGIEPGWSANVSPSGSSLEVAGRVVWKTAGGMNSQRVVSPDDPDGTDHAAFRSILGVDRVLLTSHTPVRATLFAVKDAEFQRLPSSAATFRTMAVVTLIRNYVEGVLPLTPSAQFQVDAHHVVVDGVDRRPEAVVVYMRDSDAHSVFQRTSWARTQYFLRNQSAREAVLASYAEPGDDASFSLLRLVNAFSAGSTSGFAARSWTIQFERANRSGQPSWRLDDDWLKSSELVIVRSVHEGSVSRSLEIADLGIRNAPPSEPQ